MVFGKKKKKDDEVPLPPELEEETETVKTDSKVAGEDVPEELPDLEQPEPPKERVEFFKEFQGNKAYSIQELGLAQVSPVGVETCNLLFALLEKAEEIRKELATIRELAENES